MFIDSDFQHEMNRGRYESRKVKVFKVSSKIKKQYPHAKSIIEVERIRITNDNTSKVKAYYLSNLEVPARDFAQGIRDRWSIENKLHYVKDVVMNEDQSRQRNQVYACIYSFFRPFVITIANINIFSVTSFQRAYAHNLEVASLFI